MNRSTQVAAISFCLMISACGSKELSRSKAASLIKDKYYSTKGIEESAQTTPLSIMSNRGVGQFGSVLGMPGLPDLRKYESAGWITLVVRGCQFRSCLVDISLTPNGIAESKRWKKTSDTSWTVPIAQREFIEVTGITTLEPNTATAEFKTRWIPTEDGKKLGLAPSAPENNSANFRMYDDGWRIIH